MYVRNSKQIINNNNVLKGTKLENRTKILLVEWPNVFKYLRKPASQSPSNTSSCSSLYSNFPATSTGWDESEFLHLGI